MVSARWSVLRVPVIVALSRPTGLLFLTLFGDRRNFLFAAAVFFDGPRSAAGLESDADPEGP